MLAPIKAVQPAEPVCKTHRDQMRLIDERQQAKVRATGPNSLLALHTGPGWAKLVLKRAMNDVSR
jgi:hypothetical protein